jgi:hypothetical protein
MAGSLYALLIAALVAALGYSCREYNRVLYETIDSPWVEEARIYGQCEARVRVRWRVKHRVGWKHYYREEQEMSRDCGPVEK